MAEKNAPSVRISVVAHDKSLTESLLRALRVEFEAVTHEPSVDAVRAAGADAMVLHFAEAPTPSVRFFAQCLELFPRLPLLGVSALDPEIVTELLKCGLGDHSTLPLDSTVLIRKVRRLATRKSGVVIDSPYLADLPRADGVEQARADRKCARAPVSDEFPASAFLVPFGANVKLTDVSVFTDDAPGGFAALLDPLMTKKLAAARLAAGAMFPVHLTFPNSICAQPIPARARVVRNIPRPNGYVMLGCEYWLDRMRDEATIQRFWMRCQMLERNALANASRPSSA
jgi:hypothetical protein